MDNYPKPQLVYKFSTHPNMAWEPLASQNDWDDVIDEVRNRKGLKSRKARKIEVIIHAFVADH